MGAVRLNWLAAMLLGAIALLMLPTLAEARHRNHLLRLARSNCANFDTKMYAVELVGALECALPLIRQQTGGSSIVKDTLLYNAAIKRSQERISCGFYPYPCGHGPRYQPLAAGYFSDLSCDILEEAYQRLPEEISPRRTLSLLLHHARFGRMLTKGRWRDFAVDTTEDNSGRIYLTIFFGRRCADPIIAPTQGPTYNPPPTDLAPPAEDSLLNEKNNGTFKYHAVYVWASDQANRFGKFRDQINVNILSAQTLPLPPYEPQRSIRFDLNAATSTSPETVDITGQQVPFTLAELSEEASFFKLGNFFRPTWDWGPGNLGRHKNLIIFVDSEVPGACGLGSLGWSESRDPLVNWGNNHFQIAVVYRNSNEWFCDVRTIRHEIGHNIGAVGKGAPHSFDGAHCNDAYEDEMCYYTWKDSNGVEQWSPRRIDEYGWQANYGKFWDFGHDDYWDPVGGQLPWWTTNLSRFVCPDAACTPDGSDLIGF